ncbi:MAG: hypothetical protein AVDCRST_MAG49-2211 [uncultured Thermomicrobiales bacterium]|uniref:PqqD family protein n=1 Tax=uncultured Thermomicrobiales bacterium TaxID=1645740 RepID=A0A6J4UT13_9BACT|nr:MAG: hypothetical protein AVDCRST_MAG49-2211 [uncultured Thermomicrobiales bacterium]
MSYRVAGHVYHRAVDDEVVVFDGRTETYLGLNTTAAIVWTALAAGSSVGAAADALEARTGISPDLARADAIALATDLVERGLLEPTAG